MRKSLFILLAAALLAAPGFGAHVGIWDAAFQLDPGQEIPTPNTGEGYGQCVTSLQGDDLTISCTHNRFDAIGAHIHLGAFGETGPVIIDLGDAPSPIQGVFTLTEQQKAYYYTGSFYVNVHTPANPAGEIRGQIVPNPQLDSQDLLFSGGADDEVPPAASDAIAHCRAIYNDRPGPDLRVICGHTVADATMAHVHRGAPGENGPVIFAFDDPSSPLDQTFQLGDADIADLFAGNLYVNIHSDAFPGGEARANLVGCFASSTQLCLLENRFSVSVTGVANGDAFTGQALKRTDRSGEFYFFSADNIELLVKILDGCGINDNFWVFFAATTNVEFDVVVTDTFTGQSKTYTNPQGNPADAVTDTDAFATCEG